MVLEELDIVGLEPQVQEAPTARPHIGAKRQGVAQQGGLEAELELRPADVVQGQAFQGLPIRGRVEGRRDGGDGRLFQEGSEIL